MKVATHYATGFPSFDRPPLASLVSPGAAESGAHTDRVDRAAVPKSRALLASDRRVGVADGSRWIPDVQRSFEAYLENLLYVSAVLRGFNAELRDVLQRFED